MDANAVAPTTAVTLSRHFGDRFVDGSIIGPPAQQADSTRLYLSGACADEVAAWFSAGLLQAIAMGKPIGAASALKMCYAGYTKGLSALLLSAQALAQANQVQDWLSREWDLSLPGLNERAQASALGTAPKAWRFTGEMREIAEAYAAAGLPSQFHQAAEQVYQRMAPLQHESDVTHARVLALLQNREAEALTEDPDGQA